MDRRSILAISLSLLVLLLWSVYASRSRHPTQLPINKEVTVVKPAIIEEEPPSVLEPFSLPWLEINFIPEKATIDSLIFKDYQGYKWQLYSGLFLEDKALKFQAQYSDKTATFSYEDQEKKIKKVFRFNKLTEVIELELTIENLSDHNSNWTFPFILSKIVQSNNLDSRFQEIMLVEQNGIPQRNLRNALATNNAVKFVAVRERYFCAILQPLSADFKGFVRKIDNKTMDVGLELNIEVPAKSTITQKFNLYLGPQDAKALAKLDKGWSGVIYYGSLDIIAKSLLRILEFFHKISFNWGLAIILLSLFIYFILYPLTLKQLRSMKEMQVLQPKIEELRRIYKDNPQKLNREILSLYKEHKVNPLGGCLPMLLQLPVFFALYQALMRSVELKGAKFLWIKDLSQPDRLVVLPTGLPILGNELNILPILMAIGMFVQQKMTTKVSAGVSNEQQRMMLIIMPILFGVIFYHMPSGLVLYWFVNSLLMLAFQLKASRVK